MIKNYADDNETKGQAKQIIIDVMKQQKPETTQQLIKLVQEKTSLRPKEITPLLLQLKNEDKINFTKRVTLLPKTPKEYVFSTEAAWYWVTTALAIATTLTVFTIPDDAYPIVYVRSVLGIIFVLFLPGYACVKALFPSQVPFKTRSNDMDNIERAALSFGMSLALIPIVGLVLNYTPWGIRLTPLIFTLFALTTVFATAAIIREHSMAELDNLRL